MVSRVFPNAVKASQRAAIHIRFTDEHFAPWGQCVAGVPIFLRTETMAIEEIPTLWIFNIVFERGGTVESPLTWKSYAEGLLDWLLTCEASGWDWRTVSRRNLLAYRTNMTHNVSRYTQRTLKRATINNRLLRISMFYDWAYRQEFISENLILRYDMTTARNDFGLLRHKPELQRQRSALTLKRSDDTREPRYITTAELQAIKKHLSVRNRLYVDWAVGTGCRLHEIRSISIDQITDAYEADAIGLVKLNLSKTKGKGMNAIYVPPFLLDKSLRYAKITRAQVEKRLKKIGKAYDAHALWLAASGRAAATNTIQKQFSDACRRERLPAVFHDLRHTYAVNMARLLVAHPYDRFGNRIDPYRVLQHLLRHRNIETTMRYLRSLQIDPHILDKPLNDYLHELDVK